MEDLIAAVHRTPIIDHHAHNLLLPAELDAHPLLAITTEATGAALDQTPSTLAHLRAVRQLASILGCEESWDSVEANLRSRRTVDKISWDKYCFYGIETVLVDDGLDAETVHPYHWHDHLTRSKCKRILRIEKAAETILIALWADYQESSQNDKSRASSTFVDSFLQQFRKTIQDAIQDAEVVGFKSVICYRTGLALPDSIDAEIITKSIFSLLDASKPAERFRRIADESFSPCLVHLTAMLLSQNACKKPFQFHTGLGDNDIRLRFSSSSHLQPFIERYPAVSIVLLHASYPFTKEAGYLASTYRNVYLDIGEVFPMVSQQGQENVIREALELCPSEKLTWSTDGHWFAETFLLATLQVREALEKVLCEYVRSQTLSVASSIKIVHDMLFSTSNALYGLGLKLRPLDSPAAVKYDAVSRLRNPQPIADMDLLKAFLIQNPNIKYLRLQWLDYTTIARLRILPIERALAMFEEGRCIGVTKAVLGLLQTDAICPGFKATGQYDLYPILSSLRKGERAGHATVQCEFRDEARIMAACPRTALRTMVDKASDCGLTFLVGFEIEVVFLSWSTARNANIYGMTPVTQGHCWSSLQAFHNEEVMDLVELVVEKLKISGIDVQQVHAESAPGQFEFILSPMAPLAAVDTLLAAREIIVCSAAKHSMHATFVPKAYPEAAGSGAHTHISVAPTDKHKNFLAGMLKHLPAVAAFTYSNVASYERVADSVWSGGTWIAWGTQNRETPIRLIEEGHYEVKCMDGLANPYLALSAMIGAGVQGVVDSEKVMSQDCLDDPAVLSDQSRRALGITQQFPKTIDEALSCLENDAELKSMLGGPVCSTYTMVKKEESKMLNEMELEERRRWLIERY